MRAVSAVGDSAESDSDQTDPSTSDESEPESEPESKSDSNYNGRTNTKVKSRVKSSKSQPKTERELEMERERAKRIKKSRARNEKMLLDLQKTGHVDPKYLDWQGFDQDSNEDEEEPLGKERGGREDEPNLDS